MRKIILLLIIELACLALGIVGCGQTPKTETEKPVTKEPVDLKVAELIKQMGDDDWQKRKEAATELFNTRRAFYRKTQVLSGNTGLWLLNWLRLTKNQTSDWSSTWCPFYVKDASS